MSQENHWGEKLRRYISEATVSNSLFGYALTYSLLTALVIFIKQLLTWVFSPAGYLLHPEYYVIIVVLLALVLAVLILITTKGWDEDHRFSYVFLHLYPLIMIGLGTLMMSLYSNPTDRLISFGVLLFALTFSQLYRWKRRLLVFSLIWINYLFVQIVLFDMDQDVVKNHSFSFVLTFVAFLGASILYRVYASYGMTHKALVNQNDKSNLLIERLRFTNVELRQSKDITTSMLEMTREVLQNDQLEDVLQLALANAVNLIPNAHAGSILIKDGERMKYVAAQGYELENLQKISLKFEDLFQATLDDRYMPTIIKNLELFDEGHIGKEKTAKLKEEAAVIAKSCLTCSFSYDNEFFGSINIDNFEEENIFTNNDLILIKQLAQELEIIISIHKLYEQALRLTRIDELTGVKTRRYILQLLQEMLNQPLDQPIAVCSYDSNQLKEVNDHFGHDVGDQYLVYFTKAMLKARLKKHLTGRMGGDEFIMIFAGLSSDEAKAEINKLRRYLKENPFRHEDMAIEISFGAGVAVAPDDTKDMNELIRISDRRMYQDKQIQKQKLKPLGN